MVRQKTIFEEGIDNLQAQITKLQKEIDKLNNENSGLRKDIDATMKSLANTPWNEQAEARDDIRYYEASIATNDKIIKKNLERIENLRDEIQEHMKLKNPERKGR